MSHIASQETKPGEPIFSDLEAMKLAAEMCNGRIVERNTYHWYNRSVGDYPLPKGVKASELGKNAKYVFEIPPENYAALGITTKPYELGFVEDPNNPGCYVPMYDYYCGGFGLDNVIGSPLLEKDGRTVKALCPKFKQNYDMACDVLAAKQAGDTIDLLTAKDAHKKYPDVFPATNDESTWVSIATGPRIDALNT